MKLKIRRIILLTATCCMLWALPVHAASLEELQEQLVAAFDAEDEELEYKICLEMYSELEGKSAEIKGNYSHVYGNLGSMFYNRGNYYGSIAVQLERYDILNSYYQRGTLTEVGFKNLVTVVNNLVDNYSKIGDGDKVLEWTKIGLSFGDTDYTANFYGSMALEFMNREWYEDALETYAAAAEYTGEEVSVYYSIKEAICQYEMGNKEEAKNMLLEKAKKDQDTEAAEQYVDYIGQEDEDQLEQAIQDVLVDILGYGDEDIARFLYNKKYYDKSIVYWDKLLAENPDNLYYLYWRTCALYFQGYYAEALEGFQKVSQQDDNYNSVRYYTCYCYYHLARYEEGLAYCDEILAKEPNNDDAVIWKGNMYFYNGEKQAAQDYLKSAIEGEDALLRWYDRYILFSPELSMEEILKVYEGYTGYPKDSYSEECGKLQLEFLVDHINYNLMSEDTLKEYASWLSEQPRLQSCKTAMQELRGVYKRLGNYQEALTCSENIKYLFPNEAEKEIEEEIVNQIDIYLSLKQYEDAERLAEEAYKIYPDNTAFLREKIIVQVQSLKAEESLKTLEELQETDDTDENIWYRSIFVYDLNKDYEKLLEVTEKYLKKYPNNLTAKAYHIVALRELGQEEEAEKLLSEIDSRAYTLDDSSIICADSILGRTDRVREELKGYLELYPAPDVKNNFANDYTMRNALTDKEVASMLGTEQLRAEGNGTESSEDTEEAETEEAETETSTIQTEKKSGINPFAVGGIVLVIGAAVVGVVAVMENKKKKEE